MFILNKDFNSVQIHKRAQEATKEMALCPLCGFKPDLYYRKTEITKKQSLVFFAPTCINPHCQIFNNLDLDQWEYDKEYNTIDEAIEGWNTECRNMSNLGLI